MAQSFVYETKTRLNIFQRFNLDLSVTRQKASKLISCLLWIKKDDQNMKRMVITIFSKILKFVVNNLKVQGQSSL